MSFICCAISGMNEAITLYAGPTLFGTGIDTQATPGVRWLPPARRGDIDKLIAGQPGPGVVGIVDGTFHAYPSVSHHELRRALQAGWRVFGLCSMGAIRAAEMADHGMTPWGRIARRYVDDPDFNDDEVTLLHGTDEPWVPMSEPLLHMREFLARMRELGALGAAHEGAVLDSLQQRWYAERTLRALREALQAALATTTLPPPIEAGLADFAPFRLKQADLLAFLRAQPWLAH